MSGITAISYLSLSEDTSPRAALVAGILFITAKAVTMAAQLVPSLPIWINQMALALWLLVRGLDLSSVGSDDHPAT